MDGLQEMATRFSGRADVIAVYVSEAHPADGWKIEGHGLCYLQPKTLEARIAIAKDFIKDKQFKLPLFVDLMDNNADNAYEALPERFYILFQGKVMYKGGAGPFGYRLPEVNTWLKNHFGN